MSNAVFRMPDLVPDIPDSKDWSDILRWLLAVMDDDDAGIGFIASCLAQRLKNGALSVKQAHACNRILKRVYARWMSIDLACQIDGSPQEDTTSLANLEVRGSC